MPYLLLNIWVFIYERALYYVYFEIGIGAVWYALTVCFWMAHIVRMIMDRLLLHILSSSLWFSKLKSRVCVWLCGAVYGWWWYLCTVRTDLYPIPLKMRNSRRWRMISKLISYMLTTFQQSFIYTLSTSGKTLCSFYDFTMTGQWRLKKYTDKLFFCFFCVLLLFFYFIFLFLVFGFGLASFTCVWALVFYICSW